MCKGTKKILITNDFPKKIKKRKKYLALCHQKYTRAEPYYIHTTFIDQPWDSMSVRHPSFQLCIVALFFALHCVILLQNTKSSSQLNFPPEFSQTVHRNAFLPHVENFCPVKQTLRNHYLNVHYSLYALWHVTIHIPLPPAPTRSQLTATCNARTQRLHEKSSPCSRLSTI